MQNRLSPAQREAIARQDAPFLATGLVQGNPHSFEAHLRQAVRLTPEMPKVAWLRCPLLDASDTCSVHAVRPLSCHGTVSLDVEDCKISYPQTGQMSVREPALYDDLRNSWRLILQAALRLNQLPDTNYELNAALALALETDDAEKRWLRGENIFASLKPLSPNKPEIEQVLALITARIGPTL